MRWANKWLNLPDTKTVPGMNDIQGNPVKRWWWEQSPIVISLAAAFHVFLLVRSFFDFSDSLDINWPTILWYFVACAFAIWCVWLKRPAAIGYILLTVLGVLLQFAFPVSRFWKDVGGTLFPFDVLMCFFLLFYYKRFR